MAITKTMEARLETNSDIKSFIARGGNMEFGTIAFDSSYPTNGEAISFGIANVSIVIVAPAGGYTFEYDSSAGKIKAYYGDYSSTSDGALTEVANATDLSALTAVPYIAIGY